MKGESAARWRSDVKSLKRPTLDATGPTLLQAKVLVTVSRPESRRIEISWGCTGT